MMMDSYNHGDVVVIPFPFIDSTLAKRRPAVVLSQGNFNLKSGALVCGMLTSVKTSKWPGDINLKDWSKAGLKKPCHFRMKIFTIDTNLVREKVGGLSKVDLEQIQKSFRKQMLGE